MKIINIFLSLFLLVESCPRMDNKPVLKSGIVEFEFEWKEDRYWLKNIELNNLMLIPDFDNYSGQLYMTCTAFFEENNISSNDDLQSIYDAEQFRSQNPINEDYYQHTGGDVYFNSFNFLVISFHVEALVLEISSPPCSHFRFLSSYSCPVERNSEKYPLLLLIGVSKSKSLTQQEILERNYVKFDHLSFPVGYCD